MSKNIKIIIIGISAILAITAIGIFVFYQHQFSAPKKEFELERIVINLDTTEEGLIPKLKEQGYIRSEWAFKLVLKIRGLEGEIKPGGYKISKSWNAWKLALALANFRYQNWIVIPEGLRKEEIAEIATKELRWSETTKEEFITNSKEGYLFPDTYLLNIDYTGQEVAKRMESKFNEETADLFKEAKENNILNDTLIVLASLIQREAAGKQDMPIIAGIVWKRWLQGMKFEMDATVQYALGKPGDWWPKIRPEDYKTDSPYNTYLHEGRPPAPICNPGLEAISAVIHSEDSEYLYYLHDSEGQIHPAKTYEEHKENIEKYLKSSSEPQPSKNSSIKPSEKELSEDEIWGDLVYCTTACDGTWNYCSLEPTEERTRKLRLRNLYNNTIECYIDKRHTLLAAGSPALINVSKEVFEEIKGDGIGKDGIGIKDLGWIE